MNQTVILKLSGLTKRYINHTFFTFDETVAVDCLNLEIYKGEIFGFLGPNGAGKTTTLNMIVGITQPTEGTVEIFGQRFQPGEIKPLARIGYVPETTYQTPYFSIIELLDFYAQLFGIPKIEKMDRIKHLLELVGLFEERHALLKNLSMGQRRLVDFMQALINNPDFILLDEPTVYLDPLIIERLRSILLHLKNEGKTIMMSSHVLSEIEKLSDRVAIIDRGKLLKLGYKEEFVRSGSIEEEFLRTIKEAGHGVH